MTVATGIATHADSVQAAETAVRQAMERAELSTAGAILLFLSTDHARYCQDAVRAAARAGSCTQVVGCTAAGVFTEEDWYLDTPAAAAMVLPPDIHLLPGPANPTDAVLALAAPNAVSIAWLGEAGRRFGGVSGDATGQGPYRVWSRGNLTQGRCENRLEGVRCAIGVSPGLAPVSPLLTATETTQVDLIQADDTPAAPLMARYLQQASVEIEQQPWHQVMVAFSEEEPETALDKGHYQLAQVIGADAASGRVSLAGRVASGQRFFFAVRDPGRARREVVNIACRLVDQLAETPRFGLLFPCMGRGPFFHGGLDEELLALRHHFPGLPLLGFYGNGEFAHFGGTNQMLQYATVIALMA